MLALWAAIAHSPIGTDASRCTSHPTGKHLGCTVTKCYWCDRPFQARQSGGHAQRFCARHCRLAFHAAARCWTLDAIGAGVLSISDIKKGTLPTCMLPQTASDAVPMSVCFPAGADPQAAYMPADGPLAMSSPADIVNQIVAGIAAGGAPMASSQTQEEARGAAFSANFLVCVSAAQTRSLR
jgi:hypothetical protein